MKIGPNSKQTPEIQSHPEFIYGYTSDHYIIVLAVALEYDTASHVL